MNRETRGNINLRFLIFVLCMPFLVYFGWKYAEKRYYVLSVVIILYTMIPFFLSFEHRNPQAKEIVVLAVLCAIAVVSRTCFIWIPHFKPMTAFIIITGASLGAESGFVCGAMSGFVSNFLFGQGPWTPWQMFAYAIAGFLGGVIFYGRSIQKNKLILSLFGFFMVIGIVGPILDTYSVFTMLSNYTKEGVLSIYGSGLPVNIIHGLATALCLWLVSEVMFEKLERLKVKYGIMGDRYEKEK